MEFSWTTFFFEIINFLVLVWILQRFLYKPMTNAITRRKAAIESQLEQANKAQEAAQALQRQYESRLTDWEQEKGKARTRLMDEIAAERARLMSELQIALEQEHEKTRMLEQKELLELKSKIAAASYANAARFAAQLLSRIANVSLEERICELMIDDLARLPQDKIRSLRQACENADQPVKVTSAYPVAQNARNAITQALAYIAEQPVHCDFSCDPNLVAGFHISIGSWALDCNLRNELGFFAETANQAG